MRPGGQNKGDDTNDKNIKYISMDHNGYRFDNCYSMDRGVPPRDV